MCIRDRQGSESLSPRMPAIKPGLGSIKIPSSSLWSRLCAGGYAGRRCGGGGVEWSHAEAPLCLACRRGGLRRRSMLHELVGGGCLHRRAGRFEPRRIEPRRIERGRRRDGCEGRWTVLLPAGSESLELHGARRSGSRIRWWVWTDLRFLLFDELANRERFLGLPNVEMGYARSATRRERVLLQKARRRNGLANPVELAASP